jgi:hypothetical protein
VVNIANVNETPTNLTLSNSSIAENSAIATVIGNLSSTDPDTGNTFTYSLVTGIGSTDNSLFTIQNNQLKSNTSLNFETKNSYSIRVKTTDQGGLSFEKPLTINITDVNENLSGEIRGVKWNDLNGNGTKDTGEPGLQGWTIYLDTNKNNQLDTGETSTITNASGSYAFTNLTPATYTVTEVLQTGWQQTYPSISNQSLFRLLSSTGSGATNPFSLVELQTNPIAEVLVGATQYSPGLDVNPITGLLYGTSSSLYRINPIDGSSATIGSINSATINSILMRSIAFAPDGTLYGVSNDISNKLYTINLTNAFATEIGTIPSAVFGIDFSPDGTLYGAFNNLVKLDRATGNVLATVGSLGQYVLDIDFAPDGYIYGVYGSDKKLYKINPSNASTTLIGTYNSEIRGVASVLSGVKPTYG